MSRLRAALDPKSVAIIGASENPNKVGGRPVHYLDKFGFTGKIFPINPSRTEIQGHRCYKSLGDLPDAPEMVIVAVAGDNAIGAVEDCAKAGVKIAVVMASGFGEVDPVAGKAKERAMVATAHSHGMRIVGPNSQGLANFGTGAIASFSTMFMDMDRATDHSSSHVAMLSQSGALSTVPVGFLRERNIGVRHTHATGNDADITVGELAIAVAEDAEVKLMLLYLESIPEKKYLEELAAVARDRDLPIIALKSGRSEAGRQAAQSHTGALANEDRVVDAFFEHHGIWRAPDMRGLVEATDLYLKGWKPKGRRLVAISNSGAVCVMTADAATTVGMPMARLAPETDAKLKTILPSFATTTNPIDLTAALLSNSRLFGDILPVIATDPAADAFIIGVPVAGPGYDVEAFSRRRRGIDALRSAITVGVGGGGATRLRASDGSVQDDIVTLQRRARAIAAAATIEETPARRWNHALDAVALHPVFGPILLVALLFVMFQAVFAWSQAPIGWIEAAFAALESWVTATMPAGVLCSLIADGIIAGVGAVVVFLPQILILFLFILILEASGYMVRAAFLMDRLMAQVGLSGRAFIPLLSSFACAVPGIMATRTIDDEKDRLTTILIAPLMTCSARLPVYTIIIGAFIPATKVGGVVGLQGLVLLALYLLGIAGAFVAALVLRRTATKGASSGFMMEMPKYQWPRLRDVLLGLWQRALIFLKRAGTIIALTTIVLWALLSFPKPPPGSRVSQADYSVAGRIAGGVEVLVRPIGFNRDISLALIPAMAAREVAVSAIATVYAIDEPEGARGESTLIERLRHRWSLPTALAFLMWFVFAPQCISTIAVTRRETNGWKWPAFMVGYLFAAAYIMAGITYWLAVALGL